MDSKQLNTFLPVLSVGTYLSPETLMNAPQYGGAWPLCPADFQFVGVVRPSGGERRERVVLLDDIGPREVVPCHLHALDEQRSRLPPLDRDLVLDVVRLVLLHFSQVQLQTGVFGRRGGERHVRDAEVHVLHQTLVRVQRLLIVAVEPQLGHVEPVLLDRPGQADVALDVHAADHHVGARLLHPLDVGRDGRARVVHLEVRVADVVTGSLQRVLFRLAGGRGCRHAVGEERHRGRVGLPRDVGNLRTGSRIVLNRAARGEQVLRTGPVAGDVVSVRRDPSLDEDVG